MIQEIKYACEICGRRYNTEEKAKEHEKLHKIPKDIESMEFGQEIYWPGSVTLTTEDGHIARYSYARALG